MRSARDTLVTPSGQRLVTRAWLPDDDRSESRPSVLIVHGLGEHIGRYERLAEVLVDAGLAVHGFDLPGHGESEGRRAWFRDVADLIDVVSVVATQLRTWNVGPWALMGHSVGGLVALRAVQTGSLSPDALVLSSPFLRASRMPPSIVVRALVALARIAPGLPATRLDPSAMSRDPVEVAAYRDDPAVSHAPVRLDTATAMVTAGAAALSPDAPPLLLPTLVLHGLADTVSNPSGSAELVARNPGVTHHVEREGRHELFNDTCRELVSDVLARWLTSRLALAAAN
ncbi:MAG: alpha/beta fold hydrolase [Trueperaceae bacterium]|nr:MAG: alpha/beta fold hydrolase [Trueperaceae bacterium]